VKKDERLESLQKELAAGVEALASSDAWRAMLSTAARLPKYSFGNLMLIWRQMPDASRVAGFQAWKQLGRSVRKGEHALWILAPMTYRRVDASTGEEVFGVRGFKPVPVFDVSQTDGEPLADVRPVLVAGEAPGRLWDGLAKQVAAAGFMLERVSPDRLDGANGLTNYATREVWVRDDVDEAQACKTLAHELGHVLLGHEDGVHHRGMGEVEAESVAFVVCGAAGLATDGYSLAYVARWADGDVDTVRQSAERVLKVAAAITAELDESK
jgi:hypothetical protein